MPLTRKEITATLLATYGDLSRAIDNDLDDGICHNCGHIQSGVKADACCYLCEACGQDTVFGVEETILDML